MTTIKITQLTDIGANLATSTVLPVVNMAGTPTTQKTTVGNIANLALSQAGNSYPAAAQAVLAQTVTNAAQPNITSTGTLTNLTVSGNVAVNGNVTANGTAYVGNLSTTGLASVTTLTVGATANLGAVGNVTITGGTVGQVLTTNGSNVLSWTTVSGGSYGNSDVANYLPTFTGNIGANVVTANLFVGSGANLTNLAGANVSGTVGLATYATTANAVAGANVSGFVPNANIANTAYAVAAANVSGLGNIATINLDGSTSNVLYGNGAFAAVAGGANTGNVTFSGNVISTTSTNDLLISLDNKDFIANTSNGGAMGFYSGNSSLVLNNDTPGVELTGLNVNIVAVAEGDIFLDATAANGVIQISSEANTTITANENDWTFTSDGNLILAGGNSVIQSIANSSLDPTLPNVSTMVFTPDANYNSQILVLDPTAPGHIHLRAYAFSNIDEPAANIFLGGEDTAFEITSGANNEARIHSGNNTWTFGNDGRLTFPGTPRIDTDSDNFEVQAAENINFEANAVVNIYTDAGNTTYQWQFGDDGNLTLPDTTGVLANVSITLEANDTGNITGLSLIGDSNANLYAHGNVTIVSDSSNTTATWSFVNTGDIVLPNDVVIGDDGSNGLTLSVPTVTPGTYSDWTFDQSGNLILPGNTVAINFANGDAAFGNVVSVNLDSNVSNVLTGNGTFVALPVISSNTLIWTTAPGANNSTGNAGEVAYDAGGNFYVCTASNTWSKFTGNIAW